MKKNPLYTIVSTALVIYAISFVFTILGSTRNSSNQNKTDTLKIPVSDTNGSFRLLPGHDTVICLNNRKVVIRVPVKNKKKGTYLVLHGWNFPPEDWCTKTTLCKKIVESGYCIVLPDMGKSIYQERVFPVTRVDWKNTPTRRWLTDTLIPFLQKNYSLLLLNENNFIVGLSTGARGVALVALDIPALFKGAAALSGDYNQSAIPHDNLSTGFYGPYRKFKKRWDTIDNAVYRVKEFCTPIYLGHGTSDKVVPPGQTELFYDSLVKYHPQLKIRLHMPKAGHDYIYWGSEVENILNFFNEVN